MGTSTISNLVLQNALLSYLWQYVTGPDKEEVCLADYASAPLTV